MNALPQTYACIAYSTYEDHGIKPLEDLHARGYTVYYSLYQSLGDQIWLLVDRVRTPFPEHIWQLPDTAVPHLLECAKRHFSDKEKQAEWLEDMKRRGMLKYITFTGT